MMSEEWGPWIEHDCEHAPNLGRVWVDAWVVPVWDNRQRRAIEIPLQRAQFWADELHEDNWLVGHDDCSLIIKYRIRKPRGMTILQELIENLPADGRVKEGELA